MTRLVFLSNFMISYIALSAIAAYGSASTAVLVGEQIRSYTIKIGGETRIVRDGQQTNVMAGQRFQFHHIQKQNGKAFTGSLKVEYRNRAGVSRRKDVPQNWMMELRELSGGASATTVPFVFSFIEKGRTIGTLRVLEVVPEFSYVDLAINGEVKVFRDRDVMTLNGSDKFKVKRIATNLGDLTEEVKVKVVPTTPENGTSTKMQHYEMHFLHNDVAIAKISMKVKNP
jgi:hypothetical protein